VIKIATRLFYKLRGVSLERSAKNKVAKLKDGEYRPKYEIPYVCQYASREMAERFVQNDEYLKEDPRWRESGAQALDEYVFWAPKLCGMACFSMILHALRRPTSKLVELGKKAFAAGVYKKDPANPKRLIGMLHAPFLKFVKSYGLDGKLLWHIGANAVADEILKNNFVIASVSNQIRCRSAKPTDKTGHLVLMHGFKILNGMISGFYIHNPSGFYVVGNAKSQENNFVLTEDFLNCFSGRIIVLRPK